MPRSSAAPPIAAASPRVRAVGDEQKAARRRQILDAARRVFAGEGFHAATMADVARAAGLSYGAVYWYFASKDELFHALVVAEEASLRHHIDEALAASTAEDAVEALVDAVRATFEFFEEDRATATFLFRDVWAMGDRFEAHVAGVYERFVDDLADLIAAGQRRGAIVDVPPRVAALSAAALIGQLALRRLVTDDGLEAGVVADVAVRLLLDGLRPRDGGTGRRAQDGRTERKQGPGRARRPADEEEHA